MLEMSWITAISQLFSQVKGLFRNVIVKRIHMRLFDLFARFHYILNLPRNTPDRRQKRTQQAIEELCAIVLSAAVGMSVYLLFFICYSLILVKLESSSY